MKRGTKRLHTTTNQLKNKVVKIEGNWGKKDMFVFIDASFYFLSNPIQCWHPDVFVSLELFETKWCKIS